MAESKSDPAVPDGRLLSPRPRWAVTRVCLLVLLLAVVLAGCRQPADEASGPVTVAAERRTLTVVEPVRGTFTYTDRSTVVASNLGIITDVRVAGGAIVQPGDPLYEVDGRIALAWTGPRPFWRPLAVGDRGPDVLMLEEMLVDQGLLDVANTQFGASTGNALETAREAAGAYVVDGNVAVGDFVWGRWPRRIASAVSVGVAVAPGDAILELSSLSLEIEALVTPTQQQRIEVGDRVRITLEATAEMMDGVVEELGAIPETDGEDLLYRTRITTEGRSPSPGSAALLEVVIDEADDVVVVPVAGVSRQGGRQVVAVLRDSRIVTVPVELGIAEGAWVQATGEVSAGDLIVVAP